MKKRYVIVGMIAMVIALGAGCASNDGLSSDQLFKSQGSGTQTVPSSNSGIQIQSNSINSAR